MSWKKVSLFTVALLIASVFTALAITIAPSRIVLNAKGRDMTVQAVIGSPVQSGYRIDSYSITMFFDGNEVAEAVAARYCYTDSNFLIDFNRPDIVNNSYTQAMAGSTVTATVTGTVRMINDDGESYDIYLSGSAPVDIENPGR